MTDDLPANQHWKFTWPSANVLAQFFAVNKKLFTDKVVVELGAGATGVPGLTVAILGAQKVVLTEYPGHEEALRLLRENAKGVQEQKNTREIVVTDLDWLSATDETIQQGNIDIFLSTLEHCDYLIASDVFYDEKLFRPLALTISRFFRKFPRLRMYFSYHLRDESYSIESLLEQEDLICSHIRTSYTENDTIQLGLITRKTTMNIYAGIEGGATHSHLVFIDEEGKLLTDAALPGTNMYLDGMEKSADVIAKYVREEADKHGYVLPLKALGLGLSGAEDDALNKKFVDYLKQIHGDIAESFSICSDSICTIQAAFEKYGVVIIAGTGSAVRMMLEDGTTRGVGGWGHMVGDGGSGFWIAMRAIRMLFDDDDGLEKAPGDTTVLRKALLEHFKLDDKVGILSYLYSDFNKPTVASFTKTLSEHADDPVIKQAFFDGGEILGRQLAAISVHMPEEMLNDCPVVIVGSVFQSWNLLKEGFLHALAKSKLKRVSLCRLEQSISVGAAVFAAKEAQTSIPLIKKSKVVEVFC